MPIQYSIRSNVIDITKDNPKKTDCFLVDTNVWFWMTYTKASNIPPPNDPKPYQITLYPNYVSMALTSGSKLFRSGLNLSELSHIIEKAEWQIYKILNPTVKIKEFRHNLNKERSITVNEIEVSWNLVKNMSEHRDISIDDTKCCNFIQMLKGVNIDGYDAFFTIQEQTQNPNFNIITDDGDFSTIPGINVFTANRRIINLARKKGKLVIR